MAKQYLVDYVMTIDQFISFGKVLDSLERDDAELVDNHIENGVVHVEAENDYGTMSVEIEANGDINYV